MNRHTSTSKQGSKLTRTRTALLGIFQANHLPLTELELRNKLLVQQIAVNKTTIYRQLTHLTELNLIREINFGDGRRRFELQVDHHHHLICVSCKQVDEIRMEDDMRRIEKKVSESKSFTINTHSLEFFGLCRQCA